MDKSTLKELAKKHFNLTDKIEETIQKFDEAVLVDGTKVTNQSEDSFAEGQTLYVVTEEGETVVAPEGAHMTESGIEVVVDGQGVITQVNRPDESAEEEVSEVEMAEEDMPEETIMEDMDIKEAIIEAIAEAVMPEMEAMKEKIAMMEEKMKEYMSKTSATKSTSEAKFSVAQHNKKSFKSEAPKYNAKRYEQMLQKVTKLNK